MVAPTLTPGQVLGHYRIVGKIGAGGMGVVFRAHDKRLQRDVAVKILPAGMLVDGEARRQFRKETLAVGKLNHPNIAMTFDFGQENGVDYLVTEYIPGLNLDEKVANQALPQKTVLELGIQLASGLEAAHRENVIHRDLKPGNLRVNPDGQLKILDFGLAKLVEPIDEHAETVSISTKLVVSGTLPYMAPEILRAETADARTDIWAAGAVLYEMATGKRAFPDRQPSLLIDAILHYDPVRPCLLNPKITASLEAVILKALDRIPDRRYQSARELRVDLARLLAGGELPRVAQGREVRSAAAHPAPYIGGPVGGWVAPFAFVLVISAVLLYMFSDHPSAPNTGAFDRVETALEAEVRNLQKGKLAFDVPPTMRQGKQEQVEVRVAKGITRELEQLLREKMRTSTHVEDIQVAPFMIVKLKDADGSTFKITPLTQDRQSVAGNEYTPWVWIVTPLKSGQQTLYLSVGTRFKLPNSNEETRFTPIYERKIMVQVDRIYETKHFLSSNWQWLSATLIIPLIGFIWHSRKRKRKETELLP